MTASVPKQSPYAIFLSILEMQFIEEFAILDHFFHRRQLKYQFTAKHAQQMICRNMLI